MKYYLGLDLGGTNCRVAKVNQNGEIVALKKREVDGMAGPEVVLPAIYDLIKEIPQWQECCGIGCGVPGPVQTDIGVMSMSVNLKGFTDFPLKATMEKELGLPVYVDNDANVAGLAEALVGAGKGKPIVYFATISTGIGGALIVNGQVVSGYKGYAGEIGNIIVDPSRPDRGLGHNCGAMEAEAGGRATTLRAQSIFGEDKIKNAGDLFDLAKAGDPKAIEMVDTMTDDLATGFSAIAHVCDPYVFVVSGGLLKSKDVWFEDFKRKFYAKIHPGMRETEIVLAQLAEPGLVGAAMLPVSFGK